MPVKNPGLKSAASSTVEDYLERILELINSKGYARVVDIAAALEISQASVTNAGTIRTGSGATRWTASQ